MHSVAIIDGIAEGKLNTKNFRTALVKTGYAVTDTIEEADIIVAHSAGCFYLPKTDNQQLIMLIGPPYWPGRPLALSIVLKLYYDFVYRMREHKLGVWLYKNLCSLGYLFGDIARALHIAAYARRRDFHERLPNKKILLIRNHDDAWCTPDLASIPFKNKDVTFFNLPGEHDDCWIHPERYIKFIQENIR